jgi:hypothetical protein
MLLQPVLNRIVPRIRVLFPINKDRFDGIEQMAHGQDGQPRHDWISQQHNVDLTEVACDGDVRV